MEEKHKKEAKKVVAEKKVADSKSVLGKRAATVSSKKNESGKRARK